MQQCYNGMISRNAERAQKRLKRMNLSESRKQGVHSLHLCLYMHICFIFFKIWSQQKLISAPHSTWWSKDAHTQLPRPHIVVPGIDAWMGGHKQFDSLALCSNSISLGKTDLVHLRLSLLVLLAVKFQHGCCQSIALSQMKTKGMIIAAQKLQKVSTIVGVLRAR